MDKKKIIIIILVLLILFGIYMLYNTFAVSTIASNNESNNTYDILVGEGTTITVPKGSSKTIYFHLKNTNNGSVKYALGYNTTANIEVKVYEDSKDKVSDIIGYTENKFIKLYLNNTMGVDNTVTIKSILGYENGGDLIVPDGITLITEVYTPPKVTTIADYITNLYTNASKSTVENNSIMYNTAPDELLMNDRLGGTTTSLDGGNIRYYGISPNNYIYFNCETYPDTNCELWRIIGVFDGKVKIIRNESIGAYSWDTSVSTVGSGYGTNEWPQADLMKLLNPGYDSESVGGSLYYNSESGKCYNNTGNSSTSCDFTGIGIKNVITKEKTTEMIWKIGGGHDASYSNQFYECERGTTVYSGRSTTWTGKVALPYPSDYGYAADFNKCSKGLGYYYEGTCPSNNWMYSIITNSGGNPGWLLTHSLAGFAYVLSITSKGGVADYYGYNVSGFVYNAYEVVPTLFLNSTETIYEDGADGTQDNPYKLTP